MCGEIVGWNFVRDCYEIVKNFNLFLFIRYWIVIVLFLVMRNK